MIFWISDTGYFSFCLKVPGLEDLSGTIQHLAITAPDSWSRARALTYKRIAHTHSSSHRHTHISIYGHTDTHLRADTHTNSNTRERSFFSH